MGLLYVCVFTYPWCLERPEEFVRSPRTGVTDNCEFAFGCRELYLGPLGKQPVPLSHLPSPLEHRFNVKECHKEG